MYIYIYVYIYTHVYIYMVPHPPPTVIYLFWGRLRKYLGFKTEVGQSALLSCRLQSVSGVGLRLQAQCVLRGLGLRVFGLGLKQPSIEVQYSVLKFNTRY